MPTVFRWEKYRFFFWSNEGKPLEPIYIHVEKGKAEAEAVFWVGSFVYLKENYGLKNHELTEIKKIIVKNKKLIIEVWNGYFSE
jgi:hypothetical protein